ncbi:MAG: site-specific DNA-methyltransferase [Hyphomicrobiales bacterium]
MNKQKLIYYPISSLKAYKDNARTHSKKQIKQIAKSIEEFGFTNPILIDTSNMILAGHGRVQAAKLIGMTEVPCLQLSSLSEQQKRAYVLADNKLALNAGWDEELLAKELGILFDTDLNFDVDLTGFSISEIDNILESTPFQEDGDPNDDLLPDEADAPSRCKTGDVWHLGPHRLICGNSLDPKTISTLMDGELAQMVFTDPPYNVPIDGHVGGLGKTKHREFAMASGEMSKDQFTHFLEQAFKNLNKNSVDGSIHFICMDWRHLEEITSAGNEVYTELKNLITWVKDNGGMGTFYRSRHELIFAFKNGTAPHLNTFELGQHGRYRTNVWEYRGVNTLKSDKMNELKLHPTVKPVQMIADAIKDVSARNAIVLDIFGGSGSTMIAAHKTGRRGYLCEIDPIYCDRILKRWEEFSNDEAQLISNTNEAAWN